MFHIKSVFYGAFEWARRALNRRKWRFPARAAARPAAAQLDEVNVRPEVAWAEAAAWAGRSAGEAAGPLEVRAAAAARVAAAPPRRRTPEQALVSLGGAGYGQELLRSAAREVEAARQGRLLGEQQREWRWREWSSAEDTTSARPTARKLLLGLVFAAAFAGRAAEHDADAYGKAVEAVLQLAEHQFEARRLAASPTAPPTARGLVGFGRIVALYHRSSTSYHICSETRCLHC